MPLAVPVIDSEVPYPSAAYLVSLLDEMVVYANEAGDNFVGTLGAVINDVVSGLPTFVGFYPLNVTQGYAIPIIHIAKITKVFLSNLVGLQVSHLLDEIASIP